MENNNTEVHFRKLDKNEDKREEISSVDPGAKTSGISAKRNGVVGGNGSSPKMGRNGITRRSSSVAEISKRSATQINYCTRRYRLRKVFKKVLLGLFVFVYVVLPVFYWQCTWVRRHVIYLNVVFATPNLTNIDDPVAYGNFSCARNFYISPEEGITLGTWHVMPRSLVASRCSPSKMPNFLDEAEFDDEKPVIFHLHGSGGSRGSPHRINLIKILTNSTIDCHVVTMDYRGYGESTPVEPSVPLVTNDVRAVYQWLRVEKNVSNDRIFFFGQSLGTGIAVHLAHDAQNRVVKKAGGTMVKLGAPAGMILESPYTDIAEASRLHPYTYFHTYFPFFERFFIEPIKHSDTFWDSQSRIANVSSPVLILHAEDDDTIPYVLGKKLYEVAKARRDPIKQPTDMVTYVAALGYGHKQIYSDPGLPNLVRQFIWNHYREYLKAQ